MGLGRRRRGGGGERPDDRLGDGRRRSSATSDGQDAPTRQCGPASKQVGLARRNGPVDRRRRQFPGHRPARSETSSRPAVQYPPASAPAAGLPVLTAPAWVMADASREPDDADAHRRSPPPPRPCLLGSLGAEGVAAGVAGASPPSGRAEPRHPFPQTTRRPKGLNILGTFARHPEARPGLDSTFSGHLLLDDRPRPSRREAADPAGRHPAGRLQWLRTVLAGDAGITDGGGSRRARRRRLVDTAPPCCGRSTSSSTTPASPTPPGRIPRRGARRPSSGPDLHRRRLRRALAMMMHRQRPRRRPRRHPTPPAGP